MSIAGLTPSMLASAEVSEVQKVAPVSESVNYGVPLIEQIFTEYSEWMRPAQGKGTLGRWYGFILIYARNGVPSVRRPDPYPPGPAF